MARQNDIESVDSKRKYLPTRQLEATTQKFTVSIFIAVKSSNVRKRGVGMGAGWD
jgi:hypothetical protein